MPVPMAAFVPRRSYAERLLEFPNRGRPQQTLTLPSVLRELTDENRCEDLKHSCLGNRDSAGCFFFFM